MTSFSESALWIGCEGSQLLAVLAEPIEHGHRANVGVLVVVGGPQYRVGSHRQFALLSRRIAAEGFPVMRFDYRGMGDSDGDRRTFLDVQQDIAAASSLLRKRTGVTQVVLWGLCDGASAALLSIRPDQQVAGLVLVNPWVRGEDSLHATRLRHYYGSRLWSAAFWRKLLGGGIAWRDSVLSLCQSARAALRQRLGSVTGRRGDRGSYQSRMAVALQRFGRPVLIALSGRDITAREFLDHVERDPNWQGLLERPAISTASLDRADHTFSSAEWRSWLEDQTIEWLENHFGSKSRGTALAGAAQP